MNSVLIVVRCAQIIFSTTVKKCVHSVLIRDVQSMLENIICYITLPYHYILVAMENMSYA